MIARFATFTFDSDRRLVLDATGTSVHLTAKAFDLLAVLIAEAPRVVPKLELHERLWPGTFVADATLVGLVKEVRRALDDRDPSSRLVRTSHGIGYAFSGALHPSERDGPPRSEWLVAAGRRIPLYAGENVIGRDPRSAIYLDATGVSRRHARIVVDGRRTVIEDLGSKNGTRIRGTVITGPTELRDGDRILIGPVSIDYRISESGMSTETIGLPI